MSKYIESKFPKMMFMLSLLFILVAIYLFLDYQNKNKKESLQMRRINKRKRIGNK